MLIAKNDAFSKQLDFADAEVGDRFWQVEHVPYSGTINGVHAYEVIEMTPKFAICHSQTGKKLKIKRAVPEVNGYLEGDPYFQDIWQTFQISNQVQLARKLIKEHESRDFDQEVIDAIMAWQQRVLARREAI
ncbi:MAG: hypothetical protein AB7C98_03260 [Acidithiobacillus sp.]